MLILHLFKLEIKNLTFCWIFKFSVLQSLRALVAMNENLKSQEQEFKAHCRVSSSVSSKDSFKTW